MNAHPQLAYFRIQAGQTDRQLLRAVTRFHRRSPNARNASARSRYPAALLHQVIIAAFYCNSSIHYAAPPAGRSNLDRPLFCPASTARTRGTNESRLISFRFVQLLAS